jgi:hypothetical protein
MCCAKPGGGRRDPGAGFSPAGICAFRKWFAGFSADHPARHIAELLPWNWQPLDAIRAARLSRPTRRALTLEMAALPSAAIEPLLRAREGMHTERKTLDRTLAAALGERRISSAFSRFFLVISSKSVKSSCTRADQTAKLPIVAVWR